jgi:hypothetical protein
MTPAKEALRKFEVSLSTVEVEVEHLAEVLQSEHGPLVVVNEYASMWRDIVLTAEETLGRIVETLAPELGDGGEAEQ